MIQTTDGAFKLIESDHFQKVNSVESQKIDELTGKVDQLLKTTKGKSSAWRRLWLGRFRTLKRLLPMLKRKEKISKASHGTFRGQQVQAKALNQVTTYINTRMDNMFTDLSTKYDTVASHIRRWMLRLLKQLEVSRGNKAHKREQSTVLALKRLLPTILQRPPVRFYVPKFPYPIPPKNLMDPINAGSWLALTPPLKVFPKVDDPGKFSFPCSIAGVEFKGALSDSGSSVNLVSKEIFDELGIVDVEPSLKEFGDKSEIKEVLDGDSHTDIKELSGNAKKRSNLSSEKSGRSRRRCDDGACNIPDPCYRSLERAMGRGNVQAGQKTQWQAFHGLNKGLIPSNDSDLAKKREKMKKRSWAELRKSGTSWTSWASWRTGRALNLAEWNVRRLGGLDEFGVVVSSWLDQVRSWTGPTKPCAVGKMSSSWSWFLAEGALSLRKHKTRSESKGKPKERTWAFSREDLIGIRPRRQSNHRILKIDPNMVDLREKAKQTANGTLERTSKDRIMDHGLDPVRSCDLMLSWKNKSTRGKKDKGGGNPLNTTPIGPEIGQNAGETLMVQTNLVDTGTRVEDDPLNRNLEQLDEEVVESSNAERHSAPSGGARDE
ncbi:hypothetical protein F2Q69_00052042 [Brassica cretica]|uniref:Uncharacterized protein n=1 Tax=Brassica cretica TaxID=69181 RepID=A0A8S9N819_BRACR|nr:hypothetical protein F2Q69_00052042 [Brassica cretica]